MVCRVVDILKGGTLVVGRVATGVGGTVFPWRVKWK